MAPNNDYNSNMKDYGSQIIMQNNEVWNVERNSKLWHEHEKWGHAIWQMALVCLLESEPLPCEEQVCKMQ